MSDSCKKSKRGKRGHRGPIGFPGDTGATGPCCTGPTGPEGSDFPDFSLAFGGPTFKAEASTFYDTNNDDVFGPGDVIVFRLTGASDPIISPDGGSTFLLPRPGLYRVDWQMALNEPTPAQISDPPPGGAHVQTTLKTQTVVDGSFDVVAGGVVGRDGPQTQIVGSVLVQATRDNQPMRLENTGTVPVTFVRGPSDNPNQRTINFANMVLQRTDALGSVINKSAQDVATNDDVGFDTPLNLINVELNAGTTIFPSRLVIEKPGRYIVSWVVSGKTDNPFNGIPILFAPYLNGAPLPVSGLHPGNPGSPPSLFISSGEEVTQNSLVPGDVITLRNLSPTVHLAPAGSFAYNALLMIQLTQVF